MEEHDDILRAYLEAVVRYQKEKGSSGSSVPFVPEITANELESIALELGVDPLEIEHLRKRYPKLIEEARFCITFNPERSVTLLQQAVAIVPERVEGIALLATALEQRFQLRGAEEDRDAAVALARRALQLDPGNAMAFRVNTVLGTSNSRHSDARRRQLIAATIVIVLIVAAIVVLLLLD